MEPQFDSNELNQLIPGLPDEIGLECLTRLHSGDHAAAGDVCRRWRRLFHHREFYYHRKRNGFTRKLACFVQSDPGRVGPGSGSGSKPEKEPKYGLSVFDPVTGIWDKIDPVYEYGLPLFCQVASSEGKLVMMGGWDPVSWEPLRDVFVYEFTTRKWSKRVDMPSTRSFFASGARDGKVYVAGGHDEGKNALKSAWVYDIVLDEWTELSKMSEERDECEGVVVGSEFWVVSGYETDNQGRFKSSAEVFDIGNGTWRLVEGVWGVSRCPRSCLAVGRDGCLKSWDAFEPAVQVGTCGVNLGDRALVTGSAHQGGPQAVFVAGKTNEGQICKLTKVDTPFEFSGFVQSGCLVETKSFGSLRELSASCKITGIPSVASESKPGFSLGLTNRGITTLNDSYPQNASATRIKFKRIDKTTRHIMQEVPENKRHVSTVKGNVIARRNAGLNTTIRLRRIVTGVGIESLLPLYSPNVKEIQILDKKKVIRRSKL